MEVEFLNAQAFRRRLHRLIDEYDEFHWAVAWGSYTALAQQLFAHRAKFRNVTFGVAFSQTDPDIVDALVGVPNGFVATKFSGGTFHPKVYGFRSGKRAAAIIGSANFTRGGEGRNHEGGVVISGTADERALADVLQFAEASAGYGEKVTEAYATAYRASCKRAARLPKAPRDPVRTVQGTAAAKLVVMEWADYAARVRASRMHDVGRSLELLCVARRWFAEKVSFADFSPAQRKAVAGIIGQYQKTDDDLDREWGWFGSMRGMGDFANRIEDNDRSLARALDGIPRSGEVTRAQYDRYCRLFRQAFSRSARTGGVPTASRLLAMKRPDTFLCVCKPNIAAAAAALGFARTTLNLDNYWERVVEPIQLSAWYNAEKPDGPDGELWEARAAMLDVLFYRP